jgi:hypothetical protein
MRKPWFNVGWMYAASGWNLCAADGVSNIDGELGIEVAPILHPS